MREEMWLADDLVAMTESWFGRLVELASAVVPGMVPVEELLGLMVQAPLGGVAVVVVGRYRPKWFVYAVEVVMEQERSVVVPAIQLLPVGVVAAGQKCSQKGRHQDGVSNQP